MYISVTVLHTLYFTSVFYHNQCSDISACENYSSTDIYRTTKELNAVLHMETIRTARLHERKDLKFFKRNLLGAAEMPINVSLSFHDFFDFVWTRSSGCSLHQKERVDDTAHNITRISIPWWCKR